MTRNALGQMVVGNVLSTTAARIPHAPAILCAGTGRRFTFAQLEERTNRLANALLGLGLGKGDVAAFLVSNRAEIVEIYFACARTGIVGLPLNYRLAGPELAALVRVMGAKALIYEQRFATEAGRVRDQVPGLAALIGIAGPDDGPGHRYEALLAAATPGHPGIEVDEHDPFYFNLTSGTTGLPKSYLLTHYNNAAQISVFQAVEVTRRDRLMTVFPIVGRVGFAWVFCSILYGIPNTIANFEPGLVLDRIAADAVTVVNLVPTMGAMLLPEQGAAPRELSSLRAIVFAGATLSTPVRERAAAALCPNLFEFYGMNEMGSLTMSTPADRPTRPDSVGVPITYSEVRIVDDAGRAVPPGETGEILGRSPMSVTAYFNAPEKSADTFRDGWVHTGDLGSLDEAGFLFIRGRKKDMIVTGGQNVYAAEVEDTILHHPGVDECAVFGLPDDLWGERVTSVVVPRPGTRLAPAELDAFCRERLANFKVPKAFLLQDEPLPRTANSKVQKFLLVERFRSGD